MGVDVWSSGLSAPEQDSAQSDDQLAHAESDSPDHVEVDAADKLSQLQLQCSTCQQCQLHAGRTKTVFGAGDSSADWMFVGEAPGKDEDLQGEPFVGRAGRLLTAMIGALGMQRQQVYIANVVKCRPPGNRDPEPEEIRQCMHFLQQQIELVQPKVMIALGLVSARLLLDIDQPLGQMRGKVYQYGSQSTPLIVTYHPAYLLRSPGMKARSWDDLWMARQIVNKQITEKT